MKSIPSNNSDTGHLKETIILLGESISGAGQSDCFSFGKHGTPFHCQVSTDTLTRHIERLGYIVLYLQIDRLSTNDIIEHIKNYSGTVSCLVYTYKVAFVSNAYLQKTKAINDSLSSTFSGITIYNSPTSSEIVKNKTAFWEYLKLNDYSRFCPDHTNISLLGLTRALHWDRIIIRSKTDGKGRCTTIVDPQNASTVSNMINLIWHSLVISLKRLVVLFKNRLKFSSIKLFFRVITLRDIVLVRYYNTFDQQVEAFVSYRVILHFGEIVFAYPNANKADWCVHADSKTHAPSKIDYLTLDARCDELVLRHRDMFRAIALNSGFSFIAFDFIVHNDLLILLESEFKFGPGKSFIAGKEARYSLGDEYYKQKTKTYNVNMDQLYTEGLRAEPICRTVSEAVDSLKSDSPAVAVK